MKEQLCSKHIWARILTIRLKKMNGCNLHKNPSSKYRMIILPRHVFDGICSYSGADIGVVCREALLRPIRRLGSATHFKRVRNDHPVSSLFQFRLSV